MQCEMLSEFLDIALPLPCNVYTTVSWSTD